MLDANDDPKRTWESVLSKLRSVGVEAPDEISAGGFAGESVDYGARVGVWLMPDNRKTGALEDFLRDLISEDDPLFSLATHSTSEARRLGATFAENDAMKAVLHTWLAWQEVPGRPYGLAIRARYFGAASTVVTEFVAWIHRVFDTMESR